MCRKVLLFPPVEFSAIREVPEEELSRRSQRKGALNGSSS